MVFDSAWEIRGFADVDLFCLRIEKRIDTRLGGVREEVNVANSDERAFPDRSDPFLAEKGRDIE